jgi:hypothetical protein
VLVPSESRVGLGEDFGGMLAEVAADEGCHQPGKLRGIYEADQRLGVAAQAEIGCGVQRPPISEGIKLVPDKLNLAEKPDKLNLAEKDVDADVANAFELLEQAALFLRSAACCLTDIRCAAPATLSRGSGRS